MKKKCPVELEQMGWNCFANAATQSLLSLESFCKYLQTFDSYIMKSDDTIKEKYSNAVIRNLAAICTFVKEHSNGIESPLKIRNYLHSISNKCQDLPFGRCGDSKVFIISVMNIIDREIEEFNKNVKGTSIGIPKFSSMSYFFSGKYLRTSSCEICQTSESRMINFPYILLNENSKTIEDGFRYFFSSTTPCPHCKRNSLKYTCQFKEMPKFFFVHLQRSSRVGHLPPLDIHLQPTFENDGKIYTLDLQSVVFDGHGHSYAAIRRYNQWFISGLSMNNQPTLVSQETLEKHYLSANAGQVPIEGYLLFYTIIKVDSK